MTSAGLYDSPTEVQWVDTDHNSDFVDLPAINFSQGATPVTGITPPPTTPAVTQPIQPTQPIAPLNSNEQLPEIPCEVATPQLDTSSQLPVLPGLPEEPLPATHSSAVTPVYIPAATSEVHTVPISQWEHYMHLALNNPLKSFLTLALTLESFYGLMESVRFVTREYPMIETKLQRA